MSVRMGRGGVGGCENEERRGGEGGCEGEEGRGGVGGCEDEEGRGGVGGCEGEEGRVDVRVRRDKIVYAQNCMLCVKIRDVPTLCTFGNTSPVEPLHLLNQYSVHALLIANRVLLLGLLKIIHVWDLSTEMGELNNTLKEVCVGGGGGDELLTLLRMSEAISCSFFSAPEIPAPPLAPAWVRRTESNRSFVSWSSRDMSTFSCIPNTSGF